MKFIASIGILIALLAACGDKEPVATGKKKELGTPASTANSAVTPGTPTPGTPTPGTPTPGTPTPGTPTPGTPTPGATDTAALVEAGKALYASKNCQTCHNPIATSTKKGRTAATIIAAFPGGAAPNPGHAGQAAVSADEAAKLEAALKAP